MELKRLRIRKNMTQQECAKLLGVSLRTYKSYENDIDKQDSFRYETFIKMLNEYINEINKNNIDEYNTNVVLKEDINKFIESVKSYKKRDCYIDLKKYIKGEYKGKICILYGLRRTGKSTLLFQMFNELDINQCAYIKIKTTDSMSLLCKDLELLHKQNLKYIFIDEITLLKDFINTAATLSDVFSNLGLKIVLSGADSLGFIMANRDELYDRSILIHTSFISYKEYERLLGLTSIDKYIEYGGTLKLENISYDDPDSIFDDVSFKDDESTRKYIDSSISRNIQHTLKNDSYGEYFNQLRELYDKGELTNIINRIVENLNHNFLLSVIEEEFKSHDFGSTKDLLLHEIPNDRAYILNNIDYKAMIERLKNIIDIKENKDLKVKINNDHIEKIKKYLIMLDLIVNCKDIYENGKQYDHYLFTQPGMRYSIAKALTYSLMQDSYFNSCSELDKKYIIEKILEDVKGKMLEEIVLLETNKVISDDKKAFKFKFDLGGEYDMVIYDSIKNECVIYEIKHSNKINPKKYRHLLDKNKNNIIKNKYGNITRKIVLYRGENKLLSNGIEYKNVEEYLTNL